MVKVLALNTDGDITYCTCPPEGRGKGRCNHVTHQNDGESPEEFIERINSISFEDGGINAAAQSKEITQEEINQFAKEIDDIAGCHVTSDNLRDVLKTLNPDQVARIAQIGFNAAPVFSLPIRDEEYEEQNVKNKLYFANLPKYGAGGTLSAIVQMFDKVGPTPTHHGEIENIDHSYEEGLTPDEYFAKQYYSRQAMITKGVGTSKPGYCISRNSQVTILNGDRLESVLWSDISVGDAMEDGSVIEEIRPWQEKQCVTVQVYGQLPITISYDHLVMGDIILHGKKVENLAASKAAREAIGENDPSWICAEDMLYMFNMGAKILLSTGNEIEAIKEAGTHEVRCVSTNTGFYETNGMVHHNTARKLFYATSDTQVMNDCGGPYIDAMHCKLPHGHVCVHCAHKTKGGENVHVGQLIGGVVSTNLSEGLTQASMEMKHTGTLASMDKQNSAAVIMSTLDGWSTSPIIQKMRDAKTTDEMRQILYDGLREEYNKANIKQDDFNLQMIAKKMTSYKRTENGLRPVEFGEKSDVVSIGVVGNSNNIFKTVELSAGYNTLTKPSRQILGTDAANQIIN